MKATIGNMTIEGTPAEISKFFETHGARGSVPISSGPAQTMEPLPGWSVMSRECCQGGERSYGRCHGCTR